MIPKILAIAVSWAIAAWAIAVYADRISTTWAIVAKAVNP